MNKGWTGLYSLLRARAIAAAKKKPEAAPSVRMKPAQLRAGVRHHWLYVFLPFAIGYYLSYLLRNTNAVIAPELARDLGLDAAELGLLTSAYLLTFGAVQIPLGLLLDRFGPRRVEAALLLFAAAGTLVFAAGDTIGELTLGRGLIGLGVSACLMAGLKNFVLWYPAEHQASLTAAIMVAGGLGAISASVPLEMLLPALGWRGVFVLLTAVILAVAAWLFVAVPDHVDSAPRSTRREQWQGVVHVFTNRGFWRFAPLTAMFSGGFMAVLGLWAVPWFMHVDGLSRAQAAQHLLVVGVAALLSYVVIALVATPLARRGVKPTVLLGAVLAPACLAQLLIVADMGAPLAWWALYGFCASATHPAYAALAQRFAPTLYGRASTALNLMAFVGGFALQWGIGIVVAAFEPASLAAGYRSAFAIMVTLQILSWVWFVVEGRRERRAASVEISPLPPAP
jgi:predicted MFS family arabinose efflux permease